MESAWVLLNSCAPKSIKGENERLTLLSDRVANTQKCIPSGCPNMMLGILTIRRICEGGLVNLLNQ